MMKLNKDGAKSMIGTKGKQAYIEQLTDENKIISALAIDQRGALKKMIAKHQATPATDEQIENFKKIVSEELTPYASAILLDPEYGLPAAQARAESAGLLLAYEKTGYDASTPGRLPDLLADWSVKRLKEQAFIERIGSECEAEELPFFLELVSYDAENADSASSAYAKVKPHKVIEMMKEFSRERYHVDVLKVEVPVNMNYVEGYATDEVVYTQAEAAAYFKEQTEATSLPFIFLSAGVSAELFQETLRFAKAAGSTFNGVLCGRATWANGVEPFIVEGEVAARKWLNQTGRENIEALNTVLKETATPVSL